jgi:hypothetical protein
MWSIPDEGYSRNWSCGVYLMKAGITFIRYTPHDPFLE